MVENLQEILNESRSQMIYKPRDAHSSKNVVDESICSIAIYDTANQLVQDDCSCGSVVNIFQGKKLSSDQINRNLFDPILASRDRNCPTI